MHHVVQRNLYRDFNFKKLIAALEEQKVQYSVVDIASSSRKIIPDIAPDGPVMVWGAQALGRIADERGWKPGRFHNDNFDMRILREKYGGYMLNTDATFCEFGNIPEFDGLRFVRPVHDNKLFAGSVLSWAAIQESKIKIAAALDGAGTEKLTTPVMISSVKQIHMEARFFVVDGRVISGSAYNLLGQTVRLDVQEYPMARPLLDFAQQMADYWQPDRAFVIDVAEVEGEQKIIEINCINSAGFYATNVNAVVAALENLNFEK